MPTLETWLPVALLKQFVSIDALVENTPIVAATGEVVGNAVDAPEVAGSSNKEEVTVAPATKALRRPCMDEFKNIFTEGPFVESVESRPPQIIVSNVCWVKSKTLEFDRWPNPTSDSRSCVSEVWRVCGHL